MNERIKELAQQAGINFEIIAWIVDDKMSEKEDVWMDSPENLEKFAELIVRECKENFSKVWYEQGMDIRGAEIGKFLTRFDEHFGVEE